MSVPTAGACPDTAVDAGAIGSLAELAAALRELRRREARARRGRELTYAELAGRTGWSTSMIGRVMRISARMKEELEATV